ncbi:MAG: phosphopyruvate hydratase [Planctomycetes bacterium]|nr:phosphopyruvate hydratase [Planctomycetota bacterium]
MPVIESVSAIEVLDSRGRPTVKATCALAGGVSASASVPSGASTGTAEAIELRDGDKSRYRGLGCRKAVANVNGPIRHALHGRTVEQQADLDQLLLALDGTPNKSRLGANAILAVSIAFARAFAADRGVPLYQHFADMLGLTPTTLPRLTVNLFSGGKHAGGQVAIQDVLVVPASAKTIDESLAAVFAVFQAAAELGVSEYRVRPLRADEGGLAPPFPSVAVMLDDAVRAITDAKLIPRDDVAIAIDVASSHFYSDNKYTIDGDALDSAGMIDRIALWLDAFPIVSIEDGLGEDDWSHWPALRRRLRGRALTLGDDLLCTNPERIKRAIDAGAADALLLKVNQVGTLTEAGRALALARSAGWRVTVSARSGETEDDWLADLAVGWGADQIKIGSITQSERLAKYNRLLEIEAATRLPLIGWPNP